LGVHVDGAFAEYVCIPQQNIWVHQHPIDIDIAAIFDPFGKAVHTALSFPVVGEDVLITGAGPIGIMAAEVAQHAGANHVVITDVSEFRLELARKVGVTMAVDVRSTSIADVRRELGIDEGFAVGMEMSASPQAFTDLIANVTHGGCISVLGLPSEAQQIDLADVVFRALSVRGIYGRQMFDTWHSMSVMSRSSLAISEVITDRVGFEEYALAFDIARSACCGKVVIDWTRPN
jgi:threonine 3-dehydrogenase